VRFSCAALACSSAGGESGSSSGAAADVSSYTVRVVSDYGLLDGSLRAQAQAVGKLQALAAVGINTRLMNDTMSSLRLLRCR
jgi:hypothetical protein